MLGGGSVRIAKAEVCCCISASSQSGSSIVSGVPSGGISVRDPKAPDNLPPDQTHRNYRIQSFPLPGQGPDDSAYLAVGEVGFWLMPGNPSR